MSPRPVALLTTPANLTEALPAHLQTVPVLTGMTEVNRVLVMLQQTATMTLQGHAHQMLLPMEHPVTEVVYHALNS